MAEVLRRRLFDPKSVNERELAPAGDRRSQGRHGTGRADRKLGPASQGPLPSEFPFHPKMTEVFYAKWAAGIERIQRTRGSCGHSPSRSVKPRHGTSRPWSGGRFLGPPSKTDFRKPRAELVAVADTIIGDGQATRWTGILETELDCARQEVR